MAAAVALAGLGNMGVPIAERILDAGFALSVWNRTPEKAEPLVERGAKQLTRPDEALRAIAQSGRTPLTLTEGLHWLLQQPAVLERGHCFMTIGSRRRKPNGGLDARTPALWFSNGTGRDGAANRNAPKVGWCWAGNRHTWLGFASAACRDSTPD